jgi:heme-degrading monooxygenase HmoA
VLAFARLGPLIHPKERRGDREWDTVDVITEHALLPVIPGREDEFEIAFAEARAIITAMPGCRGLSLSRSIESPRTYLLLVEWEHLEDHTTGFRQSEQYQVWRGLLHHFYEPFPLVEHYRSVP